MQALTEPIAHLQAGSFVITLTRWEKMLLPLTTPPDIGSWQLKSAQSTLRAGSSWSPLCFVCSRRRLT